MGRDQNANACLLGFDQQHYCIHPNVSPSNPQISLVFQISAPSRWKQFCAHCLHIHAGSAALPQQTGGEWDPVTESMVWKIQGRQTPSRTLPSLGLPTKEQLALQKKTFEKVGAHQHVLIRADLKRPSSAGPAGTQPSVEDGPKKTKLLTSFQGTA